MNDVIVVAYNFMLFNMIGRFEKIIKVNSFCAKFYIPEITREVNPADGFWPI